VLSLSNSWFVSQAYQCSILSVQVCIYIGTRLIRLQSISVTTVIGFIAAADTSRFKRAEDREYIGIIGAC
jgi:hypothetical protein